MRSSFLGQSLVLLIAVHHVSSATYTLPTKLQGQSFLDAFDWNTDADPNWGRVNYIDLKTAQSKGLVSIDGNQVTLRADSTSSLNSSGPGRDSFNLVSKKEFNTHVAIFDIVHMPEGCGTWPAIWYAFPIICYMLSDQLLSQQFGSDWPNGGEIDIVEGINNQSSNLVTLHTGANCIMPSTRAMTGTSKGTNCNVYQTGNAACGVTVNTPNSFGSSFNSVHGGWYAIERTPSFIGVYFWSRNGSVPKEVSNPGSTVNTDNWGTPVAYFPSSSSCDFSAHLTSFKIVINLDFCGSWAGVQQLYNAADCPSTCNDYVNSNPSAFTNAFFTFNSLSIYESTQ